MAPERQPGSHPKGRSGTSPWRSWTARLLPKEQVIRSSRIGDAMARISLVREMGCNPVAAGFDSQARLDGSSSKGKGSGFLNR